MTANSSTASAGRKLDRLAVLVASGLVLATLLPWLHDVGWILELPAHFRPHIITAAVATGIYAWLGRRAAIGIASGLVLIANGVSVAGVPTQASAPAPALRVISQNLASHNHDPSDALRVLQAEDADVLILLEYTFAWDESLRPVTARYPHSVTIPQDGSFGIAVFSAVPFTHEETLILGDSALPAVAASLDTDSVELKLIAVHLSAPMTSRWAADRNRQLRELHAYLGRTEGPVLVIGDFNNTPYSPTFRDFLDQTELRLAGNAWTPTWPAQLGPFGIPIDLAIASQDLSVSARRPIETIGSDHVGISVTVGTTNSGGLVPR